MRITAYRLSSDNARSWRTADNSLVVNALCRTAGLDNIGNGRQIVVAQNRVGRTSDNFQFSEDTASRNRVGIANRVKTGRS